MIARIRRDGTLQIALGVAFVILCTALGAFLTPYSLGQLLTGFSGVAAILGLIIQLSNRLQPNESKPPIVEVIERVEDEDPDLGEAVLEYLDVLTDEYCRPAFDYMDQVGRTTIEDLVAEVATTRENVAAEEVTGSLRDETYAALSQVHLPRLETVGVLEFDREHGTIEMTPEGHRLAAVTGGSDTEEAPEHALRTNADVLFDVLRNSRRRRVLRVLREDESSMEFGAIATAVAAMENDVSESALSSQQRKRVYVSLYQIHMPMLSDSGFVDYDSDGGEAELTSNGRAALHYLDDVERLADTEETNLDPVLEVLRSDRRRRVISLLADSSDPVTISDLSESVAAWENDVDVDELTSSQRKRVYVGLYQAHLPKMADVGVVEYDRDIGEVELTELGAVAFEILGMLPDAVSGTGIDPARA